MSWLEDLIESFEQAEQDEGGPELRENDIAEGPADGLHAGYNLDPDHTPLLPSEDTPAEWTMPSEVWPGDDYGGRGEEPGAGWSALRQQYQVAGLGVGGRPASDPLHAGLEGVSWEDLPLLRQLAEAHGTPRGSRGFDEANASPEAWLDKVTATDLLFIRVLASARRLAALNDRRDDGVPSPLFAPPPASFGPAEPMSPPDLRRELKIFRALHPLEPAERGEDGGSVSGISSAFGGRGMQRPVTDVEQRIDPNLLEWVRWGLQQGPPPGGSEGWQQLVEWVLRTMSGGNKETAGGPGGGSSGFGGPDSWLPAGSPSPTETPTLTQTPTRSPTATPGATATSTLIPTDSLYKVWRLSPPMAKARRTPAPGETAAAAGMSVQNKWNDQIMRQVQDQFRDEFTGVDPDIAKQQFIEIAKLVKRQIARESRYDPDALRQEPSGDYKGPMQIGDLAFRDLDRKKLLGPNFSANDLWNPEKNIQAGVAYLKLIWDKLREQDEHNFKGGTRDPWRPVNLASLEDVKERLKLVFGGYTVGYAAVLDARRDAGQNARSWNTVQNYLGASEERRSDTINYVTDIFNPYDSDPAPHSTPVPSRTPTATPTPTARPTRTATPPPTATRTPSSRQP